jgi:hypothetical protein
VYRFIVRLDFRTDTLEMVIEPLPFLSADTLIAGVRLASSHDVPVLDAGYGEATHREVFRYRPGKALERWPVPADVFWVYNDLAISPDGRYVAYVAQDSSLRTFAVVREVGTSRLLVQGAGRGGCDCDVDLNHARWVAADSFEIAVALANTTGGWQVVSGRPGTGRVHTDTVREEPQWHE